MITIERSMPKQKNSWMKGYYQGKDVYIIGGGPSLEGFYRKGGFKKLEGRNIIGVNHSYMHIRPHVLCFLDNRFKKEVQDKGHDINNIADKIIAGPSSGLHPGGNISIVNLTREPSMNPSQLCGMMSSGLIALNFAIISKAARIFLLGFDLQFINGKGHYYSDDENGGWVHLRDKKGDSRPYERMLSWFVKFKKFEGIYNCSKESKLTCFRYFDLEKLI